MNAGDTKIVFLQVKNTGTLDLYYDLVLNVTIKDASGTESTADVSNVLKYATVSDKQAPVSPEMTWATDFASAAAGMVSGANKPVAGKALTVGNSDYVALAVNLDTSAGDTYAGYSIEIDAEVVATQEVPTNPDSGEGDSGNEGSGSEGSGNEGNNGSQIVDLMNGVGGFEDGVTYVDATEGGSWVCINANSYVGASVSIREADNSHDSKYLAVESNESKSAGIKLANDLTIKPNTTYVIEYDFLLSAENPMLRLRTKKSDATNISWVAEYKYDASEMSAEDLNKWFHEKKEFTTEGEAALLEFRINGNKKTAVFAIDNIVIYEKPATTE